MTSESVSRLSFRGIVLTLLIAVPILMLSGAVFFWYGLDIPGEAGTGGKEITIGNGDSIVRVSPVLEETGLVKDGRYIVWRFKILDRLGMIPPVQAGRYYISYGLKPSEVLRSLTSPLGGQRIYTTLTIPPGLTSTGIAARISDSGLADPADVIHAVRELAGEYPVLANPEGLQGYLFPDTYKIETPVDHSPSTSAETAETIIRIMADRFFEVLDQIDPSWRQLTSVQLHEKVTLASIVEREYRREDEAPKIAAVFNNRLSEGMPLQSCATVVYTIQETENGRPYREEYLKFNRRIFERYLDISSPYNTYRSDGLPPGPISSPGREALDAAFFPAGIDALFFVVKDPASGTHTFTRDYSDHLDARDTYLTNYVVKD